MDTAEEEDGLVGTGTDPKTFAPIEFVVFKIVELVLQFHHTPTMRLF